MFLYLLFEAPLRWTAASLLFTALALGALAAALAHVLRDIRGILESPIRGMVTVHPLYLVRTRADRLKVYPLVRLSKTHGVHQHTNGGYTHTSVTLHFGKETVELTIRGKEYAQGWLDYFVNRRRRALELMAEGYLEAEQGVEMIPPVLLTKPPATKAKEKARALRWYGAAAVAVVAALAVIVPLRAARADDYAYRLAVRAQPEPSYTTYLAEYPEGRHAEAVKRALELPHTAALASFKALFLGSEQRGASTAIPAALEILHAAGVTAVPVTIISRVDLPPFAESDRKEADWAFGTTLIAARERAPHPDAPDLRGGRGGRGDGAQARDRVGRARSAGDLDDPQDDEGRRQALQIPGRPALPSIQIAWEAVLSAKGSDSSALALRDRDVVPAELRFNRPEAGQTPRHSRSRHAADGAPGARRFHGKDRSRARALGRAAHPHGTSQGTPERTVSPYER